MQSGPKNSDAYMEELKGEIINASEKYAFSSDAFNSFLKSKIEKFNFLDVDRKPNEFFDFIINILKYDPSSILNEDSRGLEKQITKCVKLLQEYAKNKNITVF